MQDSRVRCNKCEPDHDLGKNDVDIKAMVDQETRDTIDVLAHQCGMTRSEYVRRILQTHVHGHARLSIIFARRQMGMVITGQPLTK